MNDESTVLIRIIGLVLRIIITIYCVSKAGKLNRNTLRWGLFAFFIPILAIIWIQFMKPLIGWEKAHESGN